MPSNVWGAALDELNRARPDVRIINLETSITRSKEFETKGINYRMSPENADCLAAAAIDCCVLANNHILDFGRRGLLDTFISIGSIAHQARRGRSQSRPSRFAGDLGCRRQGARVDLVIRFHDKRCAAELGCNAGEFGC